MIAWVIAWVMSDTAFFICDQPMDLLYHFNEHTGQFHASIVEIMSQVFSYMVLTGVEFAFLTCWFYTWLLRRPMNKCNILQVSRPFLDSDMCMNGSVSTTAALAWLECYAIQRTHQQGHRHVCIPPNRVLRSISEEEKDKKMEGEDTSENDDSDYDPNKNEDK